MVDLNGPWGWNNVQSRDKLIYIIKKLGNFESMTWERNNSPVTIPPFHILLSRRDAENAEKK
jgi:hypothetical protein